MPPRPPPRAPAILHCPLDLPLSPPNVPRQSHPRRKTSPMHNDRPLYGLFFREDFDESGAPDRIYLPLARSEQQIARAKAPDPPRSAVEPAKVAVEPSKGALIRSGPTAPGPSATFSSEEPPFTATAEPKAVSHPRQHPASLLYPVQRGRWQDAHQDHAEAERRQARSALGSAVLPRLARFLWPAWLRRTRHHRGNQHHPSGDQPRRDLCAVPCREPAHPVAIRKG